MFKSFYKRATFFFFFLFFISFFGLGLRLFKVDNFPHSLYVDEVAIGYNAYSILTTGKDEHKVFLPLFFKSFGEYKLPVYIYLTALSEFFFGKNAFAVRFPSLIFGTISIIIFIFLLRLLNCSSRVSFLGGLFLAISPWHLQFSRAGFEANVALFFILLGTLFFFSSFEGEKISFKKFFIGLFLFVLSLYTYNSALISSPLFLFFLFWKFYPRNKKFFEKRLVIFLFFFSFFLLPLVFHLFSQKGLIRAKSEFFLSENRFSFDHFSLSKKFEAINQLFENYLSYFSFDFLFFAGDQIGRHSVREIGMNYFWQLPLVMVGVIQAIKRKSEADKLFFFWLLAAPLPGVFFRPNPHALRSLTLVIPLTYLTAQGVDFCFLRRQKKFFFLGVFFSLVVFYFFFHYLHIYYVHYPKRASPNWSGGYKEAIEYVSQKKDHYQQIAITKKMAQGYIYLYFYGPYQPPEIQNLPSDQEVIGNFKFVDSPFIFSGKKIIYVSPYWEDKWPGKKLETIYNQGGDIVFYIWEN